MYVMNPNKYTFKKGWVRRFCKRHNLSVQRRKNKKKKSVYERLHIISNYHWWVIYQFQDPDNYNGKKDQYFDLNTIRNRKHRIPSGADEEDVPSDIENGDDSSESNSEESSEISSSTDRSTSEESSSTTLEDDSSDESES